MLGLEKSLKKILTEEDVVGISKTDFENSNRKLEEWRENSLNYLLGAINND